jgi:hypothetical protein
VPLLVDVGLIGVGDLLDLRLVLLRELLRRLLTRDPRLLREGRVGLSAHT